MLRVAVHLKSRGICGCVRVRTNASSGGDHGKVATSEHEKQLRPECCDTDKFVRLYGRGLLQLRGAERSLCSGPQFSDERRGGRCRSAVRSCAEGNRWGCWRKHGSNFHAWNGRCSEATFQRRCASREPEYLTDWWEIPGERWNEPKCWLWRSVEYLRGYPASQR